MLPSTANAAFKWYSNSITFSTGRCHSSEASLIYLVCMKIISSFSLIISSTFSNHSSNHHSHYCNKFLFPVFSYLKYITSISFFAFLIHAPGKSRIFLILIFSDYGCINRNCLSTIVAYCISFNRCNLR